MALRPSPLEPQPLYTIRELAKRLGRSKATVRRLLRSNGVHTERNGNKEEVPFAALMAALPWSAQSVLEVENSRPRKIGSR
jgi:excisionase family DNA binding protein